MDKLEAFNIIIMKITIIQSYYIYIFIGYFILIVLITKLKSWLWKFKLK